jgi:hypothetical protein
MESAQPAGEDVLPSVPSPVADGAGQPPEDAPTGWVTAQDYVDCNNYPINDWILVSIYSTQPKTWHQYEFALISSTPTFNVSDTRIAVNDLSTPINATFTSQKSETFSISATASMTAKLSQYLSATVSSTIQSSRTTAVGVSVTGTVPAYRALRADYGVRAYDVYYYVKTIQRVEHRSRLGFPSWTCWEGSFEQRFTNAPTNVEGWRLTLE